jgi:hypothetical protein
MTEYSFDLITKQGNSVSGSLITGFENTPSINDFGTVAVVGKFGSSESLLTGDAQSAVSNISGAYSSSFRAGVEINNNNRVVAVDLGGNASAVRVWSATNSGLPFSNRGTGKYPSSGYDFENIFSYPSLSNDIQNEQVAFNATPRGEFPKIALETYRGDISNEEFQARFFNEAIISGGFTVPMVADDGKVVARDASKIILNDYQLNPIEVIASDTNGFTSVGRAPGISDNGKAVAFYGDNAGEGIFISVETDSGWEKHRIAGVAGNRILDPGETYTDSNGNGELDGNEEDLGVIGSFAPDERIGINFNW